MFSNVSNTRNLVFPIGHVQTMFKDYSANKNNSLRFVRANISERMFPSLPMHGGKHDQTSTGNNVSATMFPSFPGA